MKSIKVNRSTQLGSPRIWRLIGVACLVLAAIGGAWSARFVMRSVATVGAVTALEDKVNADDGKTYYYPEFVFEAQDGKTYNGVSHTGSTSADYAVGQSVRILYDKADPNSARIDSFGQIWGGDLLVALVGIMFLAISAVLKTAQNRKAPAAAHTGR
ncbi:MAG TPA: DUF3592 domain-containing protein [Terracidiphilus sp.]|nr:DUF3592 domain-containing protein [Terracidiphilus sp.]